MDHMVPMQVLSEKVLLGFLFDLINLISDVGILQTA